ncbi:MAG: dihydropyrimidinase [Hyphomicrobiales bacterium]|nr:dihydropyrimidinase [Hyphomicrobiales bacterium]MCC7481876.1 dihydropyrimidinase [Hyphomicrobiales bacterium]
MSTLIRGGTVVNHDHSVRADLLIDGGKIVGIGEKLSGTTTIDAGGCYVMPGGIDPHTHMELMFMGNVSADDFEWGTKAALSGGTTMIVDFCIPAPGESMLAAYQAWRHKSEKAATDYSFHMAVTSWSPQVHDEMETVVKTYGINTFKHFMAYKGALMVNDDELYNSFKRCAQLGALPLVHAENGDVVARMQADLLARGITGPEGHAYSRPPEVEGEATNRAIMIADMAGSPLYVVHTSCEQTHEAIRRARAAGKRVYGEPLIQHLMLDESEYQNKDWDYAAGRVMSPPFRNKSHQDSLWAGLQSGSLSVVATDHCSFTIKQKRVGLKNFSMIPNGTGGLEDRMPVLWNAGVNTGRLTKEEFVAVTSANIARILNMYPRKGAVAVGSDADIVIWDPAATKKISAKNQVSRIEYNVFEGYECRGAPRTVLSRGRVAWEQGDMRAKPGDGDFVARPANAPVHQANAIWKGVTAPKGVKRVEVTP